MKEKIYDARTGMEYVLVGDYYLPALKLPRTRPIGRWEMLHKAATSRGDTMQRKMFSM